MALGANVHHLISGNNARQLSVNSSVALINNSCYYLFQFILQGHDMFIYSKEIRGVSFSVETLLHNIKYVYISTC